LSVKLIEPAAALLAASNVHVPSVLTVSVPLPVSIGVSRA
jgi:hypothetical protein